MTIETVRQICRALPEVTEDVKWGNDLCFCVIGKMFVAMNLEPPHSIAFKCTPECFGELIERPGIRPAPYMARNMWVQEEQLGEAIGRGELEQLVKMSYELVVAKLPKSRRPGFQRQKGKSKKAEVRRQKAKGQRQTSASTKSTATRQAARRRR
jgi:predicted DNA-binding protein (MmcQ/YjbR family)